MALPPITTADAEKALGLLPRIWRWMRDVWAVPRRLAEVEKRLAPSLDGRLSCMSCATGRIGELRHYIGVGNDMTARGQCDTCGVWFVLALRTRTVLGVAKPGHD